MAVRKRKASGKGTLIRGADGALYHIPDSAMKAYRLPDQLTGEAREFMDKKGMKARGAHLPAVRDSGLVFQAPGKPAYMVKPKPAVMVKGPKTVMVKGPKTVMVKGQKTVMVKGSKVVMVKGSKVVMVKGQKPYMVNIKKLKKTVKGKR